MNAAHAAPRCGPAFRAARAAWLAAALLPMAATAVSSATRPHVHGQIRLDVVVEGPTVVVEMTSPLDNFVGFEHAPRTEAQKKAADDAVERLRAADQMFRIDPAANCKLGPVHLRSAVLGLGRPEAGAATPDGHADLDGTFAFNCTNAGAAKFIDLDLFAAFKGLRQIEARIAAPQGQFKRTLRRPNARLAWNL